MSTRSWWAERSLAYRHFASGSGRASTENVASSTSSESFAPEHVWPSQNRSLDPPMRTC